MKSKLFSVQEQNFQSFRTPKKLRKSLQCQVADGHQKISSPSRASSLHPLNEIRSQAIVSPFCLQDIKDSRESRQIILNIKNCSQSKIHLLHLLLEMIEIIDRSFREVKFYVLNEIDKLSFSKNQQTIIIVSPNKLVQSQLIRTFYHTVSYPFLIQQLKTEKLVPFANPTTTQQLQYAIYRQLISLQITSLVEYSIIYKLKQIYGELLQPISFRNTQYWSTVSQLLLSVVAQIDIYGAKCQEMLMRIVLLYQYKQFHKLHFRGILFGQLQTTLNLIRRKLNIKGINEIYHQFQKAIRSGKIKIKQRPEAQFLQCFRITHRFPSLFPFERSFQQSNEKYYLEVERKLSIKNHQDRRSIQLIEYALHHKKQFKLRVNQFQYLLQNYQRQIDYQQKYNTSLATYFAQIQNEEHLPNYSCLSCSPFFFKGHNLAHIDSWGIPFKSFQSIEKFKQTQQEFLATTVQFLNNGGGFVVFGVKKKLINQIVIGDSVNESQKKQIVETIQYSVKKNIQSLNRLPANIEVDFHPLRENISTQDCHYQIYNKQSLIKNKHLFLESLYLVCIKICPTNSAEIYFLKHHQHPKCFAQKTGSMKELTSKQIVRLIRRKVNTFAKSNEQEPMISLPQNIFDHECQRFEILPNHFKKHAQEQQFFNYKQINYREMCLLIARQKDLPTIKRKLVDRGYRCSIQLKFIDKKFASTKHTSVLYIDLEFERILKQICFSPEFFINKKALLTINIQKHVKLQARNEQNVVTCQFYDNIMSWVKNDYKREVIELYEYRVGKKKQYFFETKSKTICLYIYYLLNHLCQRSSLKQPKGLSLLKDQQRQDQWIKLFPQ